MGRAALPTWGAAFSQRGIAGIPVLKRQLKVDQFKFSVHVYDTRSEMRYYVQRRTNAKVRKSNPMHGDTMAATTLQASGGVTMHLNQVDLASPDGAMIVAHEAVHVAFRCAAKMVAAVALVDDRENEELLATLTGEIVREVRSALDVTDIRVGG